MKKRNLTQLNPLFQKWPLGTIMTTELLEEKGFTHSEINAYQKSNVITALGKGVFKKTSETVSWEGFMYGLQQHYEHKFVVGGKTAFDLLKSESDSVVKRSVITVFPTSLFHTPFWFQRINSEFIFKFYMNNILPPYLGVIPYACEEFSLDISCLERAVLEIVSLATIPRSVENLSPFFETLDTLRANILQNLLENCSSSNVIDNFLFLASQTHHPWFQELDLSRIKLPKNRQYSKIVTPLEIKSLLSEWPANTVMTTQVLMKKGLFHHHFCKLRKSKVLTSLEKGILKKTGDSISWEGVVYGLQQRYKNKFIVGGETALALSKEKLLLSKEKATICILSTNSKFFPLWVKRIECGVHFDFHISSFLPCSLGIMSYDCGEFSIDISCPERAVLEVVALAGIRRDLNKLSPFFETLDTLRANILQNLLENCSSSNVIDNFLSLASQTLLPWFQELDLSQWSKKRAFSNIQKTEIPLNLKSLPSEWPANTIMTTQVLMKKGLSQWHLDKFRKSKVLTSPRKGIFKKTADSLSWEGVVYGLQQHYKNKFIVGAKTALLLSKEKLLLSDDKATICILSNSYRRLPSWVKKIDCGVHFDFHISSILSYSLGIVSYDCGEFSIDISCPERAVLEVVALAGIRRDLNKLSPFFETLDTLRADILQNLLENCSSINLINTFLLFASQAPHPWFQELDLPQWPKKRAFSNIQKTEIPLNLKSLPSEWPANTIMTTQVLMKKGLSQWHLDKLRKSKVLTSPRKGIFKKTADSLSWEGVVYGLQQHYKNQCIVGGETALVLFGKKALVSDDKATICILSDSSHIRPPWVKKIECGVHFDFHMSSFLPHSLGLIPYDCGEFSIDISCPERAVLEVVALGGKRQDLNNLAPFFETLNILRADTLQNLLENCSSARVINAFLPLASRAQHLWFQELDLSRIKLSKKRRDPMSLLSEWPANTIMTSQVLMKKGLSDRHLDKLRKSKVLTSPRKGIFKKTADSLSWEGVVYGLQQRYKNKFIVGGETALALFKEKPFVPSDKSTICILSDSSYLLPPWVKKIDCGAHFDFHKRSFLPHSLGLIPYDCGEFSIDISCPERAILETISFAKTPQDFKELWLVFKELSSLSPHIIQNLLENCSSLKVKKIFLLFASHAHHPWFKQLNLSQINLGKRDTILTKREVYNPDFQIAYPKDLFEN